MQIYPFRSKQLVWPFQDDHSAHRKGGGIQRQRRRERIHMQSAPENQCRCGALLQRRREKNWQGSRWWPPTRRFVLRPAFKRRSGELSVWLSAIIKKSPQQLNTQIFLSLSLTVADAHPKMSVSMNKKWAKCFMPVLMQALWWSPTFCRMQPQTSICVCHR